MKKLTITKIIMIQNNRMVRVGVGKHMGDWFLRIDMWWIGYRLTWEKERASGEMLREWINRKG